jgi:Transglutaminase-like superfamily
VKRRLFESYVLLIRLEIFVCFRNLHSLRELVRAARVRGNAENVGPIVRDVCHAIDLACVFYPKRVLCLQRSVATTLLLRRSGVRAEMVIGAQLLPFRSHAWVEVNGVVVNDKPYMREIYQPLDRLGAYE